MAARNRIFRDIREIVGDDELEAGYGIRLEDSDENPRDFTAFIRGPDDTPYAGGTFKLKVVIPDRYPFVPPKIKFETRIFHPNICSLFGTICLDVLELPKWKSPMTLKIALMSVFTLLASPNAESPQDFGAGAMCEENRELFNKTARMWTYIYANGPTCVHEFHQTIFALEEMGLQLSKERQLDILTASYWNLNEAANQALAAVINEPLDLLDL